MGAAAPSGRLSLRLNGSGECDPAYLPRVRPGQLVSEPDQIWKLLIGQCLSTPLDKLLVRDDRSLDGDDASTNGFSEEWVGNTDHRNLVYRRMRPDSSLYFPRIHIEA